MRGSFVEVRYCSTCLYYDILFPSQRRVRFYCDTLEFVVLLRLDLRERGGEYLTSATNVYFVLSMSVYRKLRCNMARPATWVLFDSEGSTS